MNGRGKYMTSEKVKKKMKKLKKHCAEKLTGILDSVDIQLYRSRSSRPEVFYKKGVLRTFAKFTGKH